MAIHMPNKPSKFHGAVLCTRERNGYHDSDFYAVVWDEEQKRLREVGYDTTRFAGGGSASVDATDEVKKKAQKWLRGWCLRVLRSNAERDARKVDKGKRVRVVKGRKVPIGTEGEVFWMCETSYGYGASGTVVKIGIATSDRKEKIKKVGRRGKQYTVERFADVEWTYAKNVEVIDPEQYVPSDSTLRRKAKQFDESWHLPFVAFGFQAL